MPPPGGCGALPFLQLLMRHGGSSDNPMSFLRVSRSDAGFPECSPLILGSMRPSARDRFTALVSSGVLARDPLLIFTSTGSSHQMIHTPGSAAVSMSIDMSQGSSGET